MRRFASQKGFTLVETAIVLAVSGILLTALAGATAILLRTLPAEQAEVTAAHDLHQLSFWLSQDANAAKSFTPASPPDYGTFSGLELATASSTNVDVRYYYEDRRLMREVKKNSLPVSTERVADNIDQYGDVVFGYSPPSWTYDGFLHAWSYAEAAVVVSATSTVAADVARDIKFSDVATAHLRSQSPHDTMVPGNPPAVPPLANQSDVNVGGNPTLLVGSGASGSGANLAKDDSLYYTVAGVGDPRIVAWEVTSQPISYTTISDISINLVWLADQINVDLAVFVYNPTDPAHVNAGYDNVPDAEDLAAIKNVGQTLTFPLSDEDVAYVNSLPTKVVKIKVQASLPNGFHLMADMLQFTVAGTPVPGFAIVNNVDADQGVTIDTGAYQSGSASDMSDDDVLYYKVKSVKVSNVTTMIWEVTSERISAASVSRIDVVWVGQVDQVPSYQAFYVFNLTDHGGDGFGSTPDYQRTYSVKGVDNSFTFSLSASDVSYAASLIPPQVTLRVKVTRDAGDGDVNVLADQLIFKVYL